MTALLVTYKATVDDGAELRYMLRSIEKNLQIPDLTLTLVGDLPPTWMEPDNWILGNMYRTPISNVLHNVRSAFLELSRDHSEVIYLDDDYFLLEPVAEVGVPHRGSLEAHVEQCKKNLRKGHWYTSTISNTLKLMGEEGRADRLSYELHRPILVNPAVAAACLKNVVKENICWRSWYGNIAHRDSSADVLVEDGRYVGRSFPKGSTWVSSSDDAWAQWAGKKLSRMFTRKSRWEL